MSKTTIIAIEGIDGSGKSVQFSLLKENLQSRGFSVETREFPQYTSFFGGQVGRLLSGRDGLNAGMVDAKSMALWFALDRFENLRDYKGGEADYLLINRYVLSNAVYQSIRDIDIGKPDVVDWVFELEYGHLNLPRPDITLFFDVYTEQAGKNVEQKGHRDYVGAGKDVYEGSSGIQLRAREKYLECASRFDDISVISCMENGALLSREKISERVIDLLANKGVINRA